MTSSTPARKARLKRRARRLGLGAVALIAIAAAVAMVVVIRSRDSVVPLNPDLVAVATLTNETGDATLAPLGRMAAERIAQGVQQQGVADVVPPTLALAAAEEVRDASDPAAAFARATGAGVVLHGAYYLLGDSLQFQLQITDVVDGKLMSALAPVTGPREPATESLDLVRERVLGTLAAALDLRSGVLHVPMQPRSLELYRVFQQADDAEIRGDREEALRLYRAAWAMDSTFYPALVLAAAWVRTMGRFGGGDSLLAEGDSLFRLADGFRDRMSEAERLFLQLFHAAGPEARYRTMRRLAELAPYYRVSAAAAAWKAYRPHEALELLTRVDTTNPHFLSTPRQVREYRAITMGAHRVLQNHEKVLEAGRAARREFPEDVEVQAWLLWTLAALGRTDELNTLLDSVFALPHERLPSGAFKTPASAANFTAAELRAHGQAEAARAVLQRALDWLEARPAEEVREMGVFHGYWLARTLYKLERWEEARGVYEELLEESPADTIALAGLGAIAARLGESERARAISQQLAGRPGGQALGRASIAALLGEREEAVELLREALHQIGTTGINRDWGWYMLQRHQDMDLESLHGYPPFEQFLRPRG